MRVNKPFSYQEIQTIKEDLGDYLEDPEKYIRAFKGVTLFYALPWKDVMYVLGQTLTPDSKTRVFGKAFAYGDEWFVNESVGERGDEITSLPTGNQVVTTTEPDWDYIQLKVDGIRVILSDVFLKDSDRHVLSLSVQFNSVTQSCPTLCDPMNHSTSGLPVQHQSTEFTHTHVHRVSDAIKPSHPLQSPSPPAPNPSQHQGPFQ